MTITCQNPSSSHSCTSTLSRTDTDHQDDRALLPDCVQEDLCHWLTRRRCNSRIVILNREKQTQDEEPAEDRRDTDGHDDANRSRPGRIMSLLGHVRARIEA